MTVTISADTDERARLSREAEALSLIEFWAQRQDIELTKPRASAVPFRWRWADVKPRLEHASRIVPIEEAERRALICANPGLGGKRGASHSIFAAYARYNPGEVAPVHRHTPAASRFVLDGTGGYTVVEGEKITMNRGDLVLTPSGTWHDHGNEGKEGVVWLDVLDLPLVEAMNATIFEFDYVETSPLVLETSNSDVLPGRINQAVRLPGDHSRNLYGIGGLKPLFANHQRGLNPHSPQFYYRYADTRAALGRLRGYEGSPYHGLILEFIDPTTGGPAMPTLSFRCQMIEAGRTTEPYRQLASTLFCVIEGEGYTEVEGERLDWRANDVFVVPNWHWHHHVSSGAGDAVLYAATDEHVMRKLGLYRHERRRPDQQIERLPN